MRFWLLTFALVYCVHFSNAQKLSLTDVFSRYEERLNIKFSFDPELVKLVQSQFNYRENIRDFISEVESQLPLKVHKISDQYYTISSIETDYIIQILDTLENSQISPSEITILINGNPTPTTQKNKALILSYKLNLRDTILVYSFGYNKKKIDHSDLINKKVIQVNVLSPLLKLSEVVIEDYLTKGINLNPTNQSISISVKDLPLLPGETDGDIFASITALPGVTNPDGRAGNLYVRGSDTDQTMILFDNIPVYHKGHYYGTISPYNPKVVDNVEVFRNGFHPRLGGRVGGAIIINSDQNTSTAPVKGVGLNSLFGMAYAKIPAVNNKLGISVGARHSYPSSLQSPKLNAISESVFDGTGLVDANDALIGDIEVLFEDYHLKITHQPNNKHSLSLSGIYTNTDIESIPPMGPVTSVLDRAQFQNIGFNIDWMHKLKNNWDSKFTSTFSKYKYQFITQSTTASDPILITANELKDLNLRQEFSKKSGNTIWYQTGIDYKWQEVLVDYLSAPPTMQQNSYSSINTTNSHSFSPFANIEYYGFEKWYFQLGIRGTYFSELNVFNVAPRILVNYDVVDWITLKASTGWYNQYLSQVKNLEFGGGGFDNELWTLANDQQGHIIDGRQSMLGALIQHESWIFDVEYFNKTANNMTLYEDRRLNERSQYFTMDQRNSGIDLLLKKQIAGQASMWIGYSHSNSEIKIDTTNQRSYESKYVQPNVWYIGGAYKHKNWKLSAAWKYSSGLNAQSLDIVYAELLRLRAIGTGGPLPPDPFENRPLRYASMHSVDLSASYKIPKNENRKWSATFGLSFINLLNQEILVDQVFRGMQGFQDRNALAFAPNIMATIEW